MATLDHTPAPRRMPLADLIRDPALRRKFGGGDPLPVSGDFTPPLRPSLGAVIIADLINSGDLIGFHTGYSGFSQDRDVIALASAFVLVALSPETFARLARVGEEDADLEESGDGIGQDPGAGDPEDGEDDDPGGDCLIERGEGDWASALVPHDPDEAASLRRPKCRPARRAGGRS